MTPSSILRKSPAVGIDLGTTYSVVAYLDDTGRPMTIVNSEGDLITPSAVLFDGETTVVGKEAIKADDEVVAKAEILALQKQVRELQRILGKKTVENEILREAVKVAHEKKWIPRLPSLPDEDTP